MKKEWVCRTNMYIDKAHGTMLRFTKKGRFDEPVGFIKIWLDGDRTGDFVIGKTYALGYW